VVLFKDVADEAIKRVLAVESEKAEMSLPMNARNCLADRLGRVGVFDAFGG
jgi:hypothetical protein